MFKGFFDEGADEKVFLFGGWLANFREWERFTDAWNTELKLPPKIDYFNHNEALGNKDEFENWENSDRDAKMLSLANVIRRYELTGFVGGVGLERFRALYGESIVPKRVLRSQIKFTEPYHFGCLGMVACVLGHQVLEAKNQTDPVDFIFDDGVPFLDDCIAQYPKTKAVLPKECHAIAGTIVPGDDKKIAALQAADLLVGAALHQLRTASPSPIVDILSQRKIRKINLLPHPPEQIPRTIRRLNLVWSVKMLEKAKRLRGNKGRKTK